MADKLKQGTLLFSLKKSLAVWIISSNVEDDINLNAEKWFIKISLMEFQKWIF